MSFVPRYSYLQPLAVAVHEDGRTMSSAQRKHLLKRNAKKLAKKHRDILHHYCHPHRCVPIDNVVYSTFAWLARQNAHILYLSSYATTAADTVDTNMAVTDMIRLVREGYTVSLQPSASSSYKAVVHLLANGVNVMSSDLLPRLQKRSAYAGNTFCPWGAIVASDRAALTVHWPAVLSVCPAASLPLLLYDTIDTTSGPKYTQITHINGDISSFTPVAASFSEELLEALSFLHPNSTTTTTTLPRDPLLVEAAAAAVVVPTQNMGVKYAQKCIQHRLDYNASCHFYYPHRQYTNDLFSLPL